MKSAILFLLLFLASIAANALSISGQVTDLDNIPVEGASIKETDDLGRIVNQARTDANGYFTLQVRSSENFIDVYADGFEKYSQKIGTTKIFRIKLQAKAQQTEQKVTKRRKSIETDRLLIGRGNGREISVRTWFEQINDTLIEIVIPIQAYNLVSEYPEGRYIKFLDPKDHVIAMGRTIESEYPVSGDPSTLDTPFWERMHRGNANDDIDISKNEVCYFYPKYQISINELRKVLDRAKDFVILAADNAYDTNYWSFYPSQKFEKELQKLLNKFTK